MQNIILYALTVLIWGSTWFVITFQLGVVSPLLSVCYRFALAAILLTAFCIVTGRAKNLKFTRQQHFFIALQGLLLFALNYWIFYYATGYITSGMVALCFSTMAVMNAVNQALIFKIKIDKKVLLGSLCGMAGITLTFWHDVESLNFHDKTFIGIALSILATYAASLGNMAAFRNSRAQLPVLETSAVGMAYGAGLSFLLALALGIPVNFDTSFDYMWSLFYLAAFGSAIAFVSYLTLLKNIGAARAAYNTILFPIVALAISTVFENYHWRPEAILGVALILSGNIFILVKKPKVPRLQA